MKKLTVIFLCLLLASTALGCGKKNGIRATYAGNINTYCEMKDGTWSCNDRSYEYRLERRGRLPNAGCDSVFVVYGCVGWANSSSDGAFSISFPRYITAMSSEKWFTTDRSWVMNM